LTWAARATDRSDRTDQTDAAPYAPWLEHADPSVAANAMICLIHQANYLLDRQLRGLEEQFIQEGGYSERLHAAQLEARAMQRRGGKSDPTDRSDRPDWTDRLTAPPNCPICGGQMVLRTAQKGMHAGSRFWGCSGYPACKGARPAEGVPQGL
jgi:restriction system protein